MLIFFFHLASLFFNSHCTDVDVFTKHVLQSLMCLIMDFFFLSWTQQSLRFFTVDEKHPSFCLKNLDHSISFLTFFFFISNTQGNKSYLPCKFHIKLILILFLSTDHFIVAVNFFFFLAKISLFFKQKLFCWLYPVAFSLYHNLTVFSFIMETDSMFTDWCSTGLFTTHSWNIIHIQTRKKKKGDLCKLNPIDRLILWG